MRPLLQRTALSCAAATVLVAMAGQARAEVDPNSGIDFVRVGAVGNAAWQGDGTVGDRAVGRGSVGYEYSIGKFEVTTAQWAEFFNAAFDRPAGDALPHVVPPTFWGATGTTPTNNTNPSARRWAVPAGNEMVPVGNISWRMAAMYCNWLHNDKATNREAFLNGAYDASTFGYSGTTFTDQLAHSPGARYWVPTWDEWLKAAHYDPNKANPDGSTGGWWKYSTSSDTAPAYGPAGVRVRTGGVGVVPAPDPNGPLAQANAGWDGINFVGSSPFAIPLGAYANVTSPWGLYDTAGGTKEWTEEPVLVSNVWPIGRFFDGSAWATPQAPLSDQIYNHGGDFPSLSTFDLGFRIASSVPSPGLSALALVCLAQWSRRRRPRAGCHRSAALSRLVSSGVEHAPAEPFEQRGTL